MGSKTFQRFRKIWQTSKPTDQPTNWQEDSLESFTFNKSFLILVRVFSLVVFLNSAMSAGSICDIAAVRRTKTDTQGNSAYCQYIHWRAQRQEQYIMNDLYQPQCNIHILFLFKPPPGWSHDCPASNNSKPIQAEGVQPLPDLWIYLVLPLLIEL